MTLGDKVPSFSLIDEKGQTITDQTFKGKWTVLYLYPKDMTPGCTTESCDFRDNKSQFEDANTQIFGLSKDSEESHQKFISKHKLNFSLIVDTERQLIEALGMWQKKKLYGREYMGIVRSTFIIDPDCIIRKIYQSVKVKGHIETVFNDLIALQN